MIIQSKIKAVLFDRDGVLLDYDEAAALEFFTTLFAVSSEELFQHWEGWGRQVGFPKTLQEEKEFFEGFWNYLSDYFKLSGKARQQLQALDYTKFLKPFPEVETTLKKLKQAGIAMGVLSNFSLASLESSLEKTQLLNYFKIACAATVIGVSKPEPRAYQIALAQLGSPAKQTLFIDDKIENVLGAKNVGMPSLLLNRSLANHLFEENTIVDLSGVLEYLSFSFNESY